MSTNKIQLFENRKVRSVWDETVTNCHGFQKSREWKSLRDYSPLTQRYYKFFVFHPLL